MFHSIIDRFLGNAEEVVGDGVVTDSHLRGADKIASDRAIAHLEDHFRQTVCKAILVKGTGINPRAS